ncbi:MAG: RNA-binding S4 domain-containing protein [Lachnospiraceae bacterium]|nr:RNA-binding S4 domain-containing protein [Lachnospiraceae bacterium]
MQSVYIRDEFIKLGQALKLSGLADSGVEAKELICEGKVFLNGETECRRGKKCYPGDIIKLGHEEVIIESKENDH